MALENKLGLNGVELMRAEEQISKRRAKELYDGLLDTLKVGTYAGLQAIHRHLFEEIYPFAGQTHKVNMSKGGFRFASALYLDAALAEISAMPHSTFDEIVAKYVEMNIAHPFLEGNGRSMRIWLDAMLKASLGRVVDWQRIDREDYMLAMERSPVRSTELKTLLQNVLTERVNDRDLYMHSIDASYGYEGYAAFRAEEV